MGGEGVAVAVVVLLLLGYLTPALFRRRKVINGTAIDERFSAQLHTIEARARFARHNCTQHGTIFTTERTLDGNTMTEQTRSGQNLDVRAIARTRAQAKARIAKRAAQQSRLLVLGAVLVIAAVATWIAVPVAQLEMLIPALLSGGVGVFAIGFYKYLGHNARANRSDYEVIREAAAILTEHRAVRGRRTARTKVSRVATETEGLEQLVANTASRESQRQVNTKPQASSEAQLTAELQVSAEPQVSGETEVETIREAREAAAPSSIVATEVRESQAVRASVPSYTVKPKIVKRAVKPFVPEPAAEAPVPYRPKALGERFGEENVAPANTAPEMTGHEELRADVLGSGSSLDALLARRRA